MTKTQERKKRKPAGGGGYGGGMSEMSTPVLARRSVDLNADAVAAGQAGVLRTTGEPRIQLEAAQQTVMMKVRAHNTHNLP